MQSPSTFAGSSSSGKIILKAENLSVYYGGTPALRNVTLPLLRNHITGLIGPSGCGKSTLLRCFNRLNDLIKGAQVKGRVFLDGRDLYDVGVHPVEIRRRVGMVFQRPNPFPKSIYNNIAVGLRVNGFRGDIDGLVEQSLRQVGLWNEVKDNLRKNALSLSGGQQQRLCIARAIALQPEVILMDEPCSALDPISTARIEELLRELKQKYTIAIVTHNLKQASLVSDRVAFFDAVIGEGGNRVGRLVEYDRTEVIFQRPNNPATRDYVTGRRLQAL
ncbi:phosphate ABC transporter, ATP-binding protein [Rubidibacter lacunae KORDI 51-2]|uniref:Phosphate ABC transporter, ATP-binding protein n=1 Tax=Rubidibacter lacunae KORDI 51-2 TaxID=582515 RepID=U5DAF8_9CHRO|nr:phosphate ABC transporter ATP-binding protein PstB [Rubidibacter lacunae]ERN41553.1 phosphate ABC transporter, ATP-binding protein [Rubidibacter lacunae KORDI 51-2]